MPLFGRLADLARGVERVLLPAECLVCGEAVPASDGDALVCALCRTRWVRVPPPLCDRCGAPRTSPDPCLVCREWPCWLGRVRSAVWLDPAARRVVHRLKYGGWWRAAEAMASAMRGLDPLTGRLFLVPIPLGRRRMKRRGYNQSERLARALGTLTGLPVRDDLLRRDRETRSQTRLTPEERSANVADAFRASPLARDRRCVLVDDVFTTGATLVSAGAALAAAGAAEIEGVTFARTANVAG